MTIDQLKPFCSTDNTRFAIQAPFSQGEWTIATNGHLAVRVSRLADVGENKDAPDALKLFTECNFDDPGRAWVDPPEPVITVTKCTDCEGTGFVKPCHKCVDDRNCKFCDGQGWVSCSKDDPKGGECYKCDGQGENRSSHVDVVGPKGDTRLASIYIELIRTLPNCKIGLFGSESGEAHRQEKSSVLNAVCLRFDGGLGLLMPMRL